MSKLKGQVDAIIKMYNEGKRIYEIATKYGVNDTTIHRLLHKHKIPVERKNYKPSIGRRRSKYNMKKREFSSELIAKMKENTRINNGKIEYVRSYNSIQDQRLVRNILNKRYMAV